MVASDTACGTGEDGGVGCAVQGVPPRLRQVCWCWLSLSCCSWWTGGGVVVVCGVLASLVVCRSWTVCGLLASLPCLPCQDGAVERHILPRLREAEAEVERSSLGYILGLLHVTMCGTAHWFASAILLYKLAYIQALNNLHLFQNKVADLK